MLTLQSNNEIRINKGDTALAPFLINIGNSLRPIGYEFNKPISVTITPDQDVDFYEDAWREKVLDAGTYTLTYTDNIWYIDSEEIEDIKHYGFIFKGDIADNTEITVVYELIDNDSKVFFQMWPILQDPDDPLIEKAICPKDNTIKTYLRGELIREDHTNTVDSQGRILLKFKSEDTEDIWRGKYLYQLRANLYNAYSGEYELKTMINRTGFYVIDDNFSERIW